MSDPTDLLMTAIRAEPLMGLRCALYGHFQKRDFTKTEYTAALEMLRLNLPVDEQADFQLKSEAIAKTFREDGPPRHLEVSGRQGQLLLACHMLRYETEHPGQLARIPVYRAKTQSPMARDEMITVARHIASFGLNRNTRFQWGNPGSAFYNQSEQNLINIDFLGSLIIGFDAARAITYHEVAHSKVSRGRTEREGELLQRQIALDNHAKETGVALTGEKKKEFELLAAERTLRGNLWNEAENSVANRFTVNQGESLRQPYGLYLNRAETATEGDQCELQQDDQDPNQRFANTLRAIRMSFFCNNGYFPDTEEGWKSAGVQTAWLKAVDPATGEELSPEASLKLLKELCGGKAGIEHLQAGRLDRMRGAEWLEQVTQRYADQRNAIITVLWDQFAARDAKEILANKEAETDKKQNEAPEEDGKNAPPPSGGPQESPSSTPPEPSLGQPPEPSGAKPDEAEPQPESVREPEPVTVMLDDLLKVAEKDDHAAAVLKKMEEAAGKGDAGSMPVQPVPGKTMDIPEAKVGDWSDYESCCAQFGPDIRQVHQLLQKIQERRTRAMPIPSHQYSLMPEDGDMTRFDESRHKDLIKRIVTGRNVSEDDVRRFGDDHDQRRPAPIDWVMLTDGSGSMYQKKGLSGTRWPFAPVQAAMQIGCIVNEAARDTNVNVYNGLWGNATPLLLSQPGDSRHATGEAIAGIADSQNWGTQLAPSIHHMAGVLADRRQPSEIAGNTHFNIISDGDLMDSFAAQAMLEDLLTHSRHSTVDIVVIQDQESKMDRLAEQLRQKFGGRVGHVHCNAPQEAHEAIIGLMQQRLQSTRQGDGVQRDVKRREMARARDAMEQRGR